VAEFVKSGLFDRSVTLEVLKTKRRVSIMQYVNKTKKHLLVTGTPTFDETGKISLVVVNERDMTQLNAMKTKLEQSRMVTEKFRDELAELSMLELKAQDILAESKLIKQVLSTALKLARLEASNILIMGESGTGKGLLAKFIHNQSKRKGKPFIQINCAALPEGLLEAELFGYEKGAFTGAREHGKIGLFELSQDGTLFLDEIGDLPLMVQAKLLKYLDDNEIMRLGGVKPIKVDCTIIAATNRDLESLTKTRAFREDLFYRLNTFPLRIPPLRARREDILLLAQHYLSKYNQTYGMEKWISPAAFAALHSYPFPGNVRELKNIIKNAVVMSEEEGVDEFILKSLAREPGPAAGKGAKSGLRHEKTAAEKEALQAALARCRSTREMAKYLQVSQPTIVRKLKKYALPLPSIHK
jgi:transcriptional regulator with PAS, ATPase and Fis domain